MFGLTTLRRWVRVVRDVSNRSPIDETLSYQNQALAAMREEIAQLRIRLIVLEQRKSDA